MDFVGLIIHISQDFSKILVVLGFEIQGGGEGGVGSWYPYKANDKIDRVKMNVLVDICTFKKTA